SIPAGSMASGVQDSACASEASHPGRLHLVSGPPARGVSGAARRAPESLTGPLQLLRGQWEPEEFGLPAVARPSGVAQVAVPSQPAGATDVGEVQGDAPRVPSPPPSGHGADLGGRIAARRSHGGAGWWKSPCPDLGGPRLGNWPGLPDLVEVRQGTVVIKRLCDATGLQEDVKVGILDEDLSPLPPPTEPVVDQSPLFTPSVDQG